MAVNPRSSIQIANRDANPVVLNDPEKVAGFLRSFCALVLCVTADSDGSIYRFFQVPSNAVIRSLTVTCDALGAGSLLDIGVYETVANGGAAVNDELFADDIDVSGALTKVDKRYSILTPGTAEQALWQLLGLAADPQKFYDIGASADAAVNTGGNIVLEASVLY